MLIYIIALIVITIFLLSAVLINLSFGLEWEKKAEAKRDASWVTHPQDLRDPIFQSLAE